MDTTRPELLSRFRRCLVGKADGEALTPDMEKAAVEFWEFYDPILRRFIRRFAPRGLAEDIYSAVWTGICRQLPSFDYDSEKGRFRSWLFRLAKNVTIDEYNRHARQIQFEIDNYSGQFWQAVVDCSTGDPSQSIEREWCSDVAIALTAAFRAEAPEQELRTFELAFVEGLRPLKIASAMDVSPAAARQNLKRVRNRLKCLAKRLFGPGENDE